MSTDLTTDIPTYKIQERYRAIERKKKERRVTPYRRQIFFEFVQINVNDRIVKGLHDSVLTPHRNQELKYMKVSWLQNHMNSYFYGLESDDSDFYLKS